MNLIFCSLVCSRLRYLDMGPLTANFSIEICLELDLWGMLSNYYYFLLHESLAKNKEWRFCREKKNQNRSVFRIPGVEVFKICSFPPRVMQITKRTLIEIWHADQNCKPFFRKTMRCEFWMCSSMDGRKRLGTQINSNKNLMSLLWSQTWQGEVSKHSADDEHAKSQDFRTICYE